MLLAVAVVVGTEVREKGIGETMRHDIYVSINICHISGAERRELE